MAGKLWSEHETRKLRRALIEGGIPLAIRRLSRTRNARAVRSQVIRLNIDVMSLGPVRLATVNDIAVALDISPSGAQWRVDHNVLMVRRGKIKAIPACHLQALLNTRPTPVDGLPAGYMTTRRAADLLGMDARQFRRDVLPTILGCRRFRVPGSSVARAWAIPEAEVYRLLAQRRAA